MYRIVCVAALLAVLMAAARAPAQEPIPEDPPGTGSTVLLPVLGYTPDTGLMLGGIALRFFSLEPEFPDARPSVFSPTFVYTLKNQIMVYLGFGLNWDQDRNAVDIVPSYVKFPDQYYGQGRDVSLADEEDYTSEKFELAWGATRRVWRGARVGLNFRLLRHSLVEIEPAGRLASGAIAGVETSWLSGLGPIVAWDSRDNTWDPDDGLWLQANVRFGASALGSDVSYEEYILDLRGYRTVSANLVLAGQFLGTHLAGEAPFYLLPRLGGDEGLRGYRGGLYLDRARALARLELRRRRVWGRLGAVAFAGIGDVAPELAQLTLSGQLWTAGLGLRYLVDERERVNVRVDFGWGNGDSGFYLSLGEAF